MKPKQFNMRFSHLLIVILSCSWQWAGTAHGNNFEQVNDAFYKMKAITERIYDEEDPFAKFEAIQFLVQTINADYDEELILMLSMLVFDAAGDSEDPPLDLARFVSLSPGEGEAEWVATVLPHLQTAVRSVPKYRDLFRLVKELGNLIEEIRRDPSGMESASSRNLGPKEDADAVEAIYKVVRESPVYKTFDKLLPKKQ